MNKILGIFLFLLVFPVSAGSYMLLPVDSVYDGDTIKTHVNERRLPDPLNRLSIRVRGIDTPEMPAKSYYETGKLGRADCVQEAELAIKARNFVFELARTSNFRMKVENFEWDKYGGRIVGDVKINGVSVAQELIDAGLAVPYDGGTKTHDWCI